MVLVISTAGFGCILTDEATQSFESGNSKWMMPTGKGKEQPFFLVNQAAGLCLDVQGSTSAAIGTRLETYPCERSGYDAWGYNTDQLWYMDSDHFIRNLYSDGKCIDVNGAPGTANGASLQLHSCELSGKDYLGNPTDQRWYYSPSESITNIQSGKCIDLPGVGIGSNLLFQLWDCEPVRPQSDQRWLIEYFPGY